MPGMNTERNSLMRKGWDDHETGIAVPMGQNRVSSARLSREEERQHRVARWTTTRRNPVKAGTGMAEVAGDVIWERDSIVESWMTEV